jgi:tRNA threonylcarbamoyladenosine biosynthesis protein TsaE
MRLVDDGPNCAVVTCNAQETEKLGVMAGRRLLAGDVVALIGELGSGKTCFTRGVGAGLGIDSAVPVVSPTFTLINEYRGATPLFHFDLYRIDDVVQVLDLGCEEYFGGGGVTIIEWGEKAARILPQDHLQVEFLFEDETIRKIIFKKSGKRFGPFIESLKETIAVQNTN